MTYKNLLISGLSLSLLAVLYQWRTRFLKEICDIVVPLNVRSKRCNQENLSEFETSAWDFGTIIFAFLLLCALIKYNLSQEQVESESEERQKCNALKELGLNG